MATNLSTTDTTTASEPKAARVQKRRSKPPADAAERTTTRVKPKKAQMPLEVVIQKQQWQYDRALVSAIAKGRERGFVSVADYEAKRAAWQAKNDKKAIIGQGERNQGAGYAIRRGIRISGDMLKIIAGPALLVIGLWQAPHFFHTKSSVFGHLSKQPDVVTQPAPLSDAFTAAWFLHILPQAMATFGVLLLGLYLARIYFKRRRHKAETARQEGQTAAMLALARSLERVNE